VHRLSARKRIDTCARVTLKTWTASRLHGSVECATWMNTHFSWQPSCQISIHTQGHRVCAGDMCHTLKGPGSLISCVRFSKDSAHIVSASLDGIVNVWRNSNKDSESDTHAHHHENKDSIPADRSVCGMAISRSHAHEEDQQKTLQQKAPSNSREDSACTTVCSWSCGFDNEGTRLGEGHDEDLTINYCRGADPGNQAHVGGVTQNDTCSVHTSSHICGEQIRTGYEDTCTRTNSCSGSWSLEQSFTAPEAVHSVAFSPDQRHIACCCLDKTIIVWCLLSRNTCCVLRGHRQSVLCCAWSCDGAYLASGGEDMSVRVWHVQSGRQVRSLTHT
jgi:WD40 repeat protein